MYLNLPVRAYVCVCAQAHVCVSLCVCVCVRERERGGEREGYDFNKLTEVNA